MKILILANNDVGLFKFRKELLKELVAYHNVYVSVPDGDFIDEIKNMGCRVRVNRWLERRGKNPLKDLKLFRHYCQIIHTIQPHVVFTYTVKPNVYGGIACRKYHIPYVANVTGLGTAIENGGLLQKITLLLYKIGLKNAQKVFFQNKENRDFMVRHGMVAGNYDVLPGSGVNIQEHYYVDYPVDDGGMIFLTIGRIMKDKGIDEILSAAETLRKEYPNCRLRLIGGFDEQYEEKVKKFQSRGVIEYIGQQKDIHPFLAESHAVIHASYHEGMSNVLLESAATGRPVIASDIPGCRETYEEGITGIGFKPKDVEDLVRALIQFVNLSYDEKKEMGRAGRKKIEKEFDRRIVIKAYQQEIDKIAEEI
jgi:glycosyltransferase involved in cell wall biosynthesis